MDLARCSAIMNLWNLARRTDLASSTAALQRGLSPEVRRHHQGRVDSLDDTRRARTESGERSSHFPLRRRRARVPETPASAGTLRSLLSRPTDRQPLHCMTLGGCLQQVCRRFETTLRTAHGSIVVANCPDGSRAGLSVPSCDHPLRRLRSNAGTSASAFSRRCALPRSRSPLRSILLGGDLHLHSRGGTAGGGTFLRAQGPRRPAVRGTLTRRFSSTAQLEGSVPTRSRGAAPPKGLEQLRMTNTSRLLTENACFGATGHSAPHEEYQETRAPCGAPRPTTARRDVAGRVSVSAG
jgi:hypothetical protein